MFKWFHSLFTPEPNETWTDAVKKEQEALVRLARNLATNNHQPQPIRRAS